MGDYLKKSEFDLSVGQKGKPQPQDSPAIPPAPVDTDAIANAVIQAIGQKMKPGQVSVGGGDSFEEFDESKTMERLAEGMTLQRGDKESNFDDLGNVKESETREDVQSRIDLLSDLEDE